MGARGECESFTYMQTNVPRDLSIVAFDRMDVFALI